jgi:hypothetical protein
MGLGQSDSRPIGDTHRDEPAGEGQRKVRLGRHPRRVRTVHDSGAIERGGVAIGRWAGRDGFQQTGNMAIRPPE